MLGLQLTTVSWQNSGVLMPNFTPPEDWMVHFRKEVNARGTGSRGVEQLRTRYSKRKVEPSPQRRDPKSITPQQRQITNWLISNEASKHMLRSTTGAGPKETAASRKVESLRADILQTTLDGLTSNMQGRKVIEPVFKKALQKIVNVNLGNMVETEKTSEMEMTPEALAVAGFSKPKITLKKKETLEGINLDKNGKPRYAKGNQWGKRPGSLAPLSILDG